MEDDKKEHENDEQREDAAKKNAPTGGSGTPQVDDKARIKELETENKQLKQQVLDLQQQVQELEAASKAAANKSRAAKLVARLEKSGIPFVSDEEREKELARLAELSDDAFAATEAAFDKAIQAKPEPSKADDAKNDNGEDKAKPASSQADRQLRTDAGVRPLDIDDKKISLEDKLKTGFMAAYHDRIGADKS